MANPNAYIGTTRRSGDHSKVKNACPSERGAHLSVTVEDAVPKGGPSAAKTNLLRDGGNLYFWQNVLAFCSKHLEN